MEVLIYVDDGVVDRSRLETPRAFGGIIDSDRHPIKTVDRTYFTSGHWEDRTAAIVVPGGRDVPYATALAGEPNTRIRRFVESGGSYLGFCAGGYYGARTVEFDRGLPLEVVGTRELAFFAGAAVGPAYGPGTFAYESDVGARAAAISWRRRDDSIRNLRVFYNGGCIFRDAADGPETTVIGRYAELPGSPAAIISCRVGDGVAILSGVHPEYAARSFRGASGALSSVYERLVDEEEARRALLADLFSRAGLSLAE